MDFLDAICIHDAALFFLHQIANENGANWDFDTGRGMEIRYRPEQSPQVVRCMTDLIRAKRSQGRSVKADKKILDKAQAVLREYFPTVDRDEQIKILKYIND